MFSSKNYRHAWLLIALIALAPLWVVGMFERGYWTPDEPREGDIAWRMSVQHDRSLPHLADRLFLEKPPLSYWNAAASIQAFGNTPAAARMPNLLYAIITTVAIGMLVFSMTGAMASAIPAAIAAVVAGSTLTSYQVAIWLAPDACLVAGCAIALLGLYRGYVAVGSREKFLWYSLMHVGALMGFMAKSGPGWIVPALTMLVLVAWERRWQELKRRELWAGSLLQLAAIGAWMIAVWHEPQGEGALRVLFWNNLVGRFADLHAAGALDYASAHKNWFGKYFVELPYYLLPWTALICAALHRAWSSTRIAGAIGTPWRFAIAASLPFVLLLSLATTARSIYIAPALLGLSVLVGLWCKDIDSTLTQATVRYVAAARYTVCVFVVLLLVSLGLLNIAEPSISLLSAFVIVAIAAASSVWRSLQSQRQHRLHATLGWLYAAYALAMVVGGSAMIPQIDHWQNLKILAQAIKRDTTGHALALLQPDETTIAILDDQLQTPSITLEGSQQQQLQLVTHWLHSNAAHSLILIDLPGHASGKLTQLLNRFRKQSIPDDGILATLQRQHVARLVARYELPQGRRYALIESEQPPLLAGNAARATPKS